MSLAIILGIDHFANPGGSCSRLPIGIQIESPTPALPCFTFSKVHLNDSFVRNIEILWGKKPSEKLQSSSKLCAVTKYCWFYELSQWCFIWRKFWNIKSQLSTLITIWRSLNLEFCSMMFYDVLWCWMMLCDVLCLKSILGFLFSEHTSGVSPVICSS